MGTFIPLDTDVKSFFNKILSEIGAFMNFKRKRER